MGSMGLDFLILVHCPLATQCHSPPLPSGCQGNWANTTPAGSPKPSPNSTEPLAGRGRQATHCLGRRKLREAGPTHLVSLPFLSPKKALTFLTPAQGGHRELGRPSCGKAAHSSLGLEKEGPQHAGGYQCASCPREQTSLPRRPSLIFTGSGQGVGRVQRAELREASIPCTVCGFGSLQ